VTVLGAILIEDYFFEANSLVFSGNIKKILRLSKVMEGLELVKAEVL
jgi:hypothetical protein